jgi:hypothetical protein
MNDDRQAFEAWCKRENINHTTYSERQAYPPGTYTDTRTWAAWQAWQAARAASPVPQPAAFYAAQSSVAVTSEWCRGWDDCRRAMLAASPASPAQQPCACVSASVDGCWQNHHPQPPHGSYCRRRATPQPPQGAQQEPLT